MNAVEAGRAGRWQDWILPFWLELQIRGEGAAEPDNHTARNWTTLGNPASDRKAVVDERGLVSRCGSRWSLDWWIGADDRWHFPSRDAGVRQRLVGDTPVVETAMRVPGGDAVHRAYAVRAPSGMAADELLVIEIDNQTSVPFAVAIAVRPYDLTCVEGVERIEITDATVRVNGLPGLLLPGPPRRAAGSTFEQGDSMLLVEGGLAGGALPQPLQCRRGLAQAAFLYPLAHTAVLRAAIPLVAPPKRRTRRPTRRPVPGPRPAGPARLPSAADVARGWQAQSRRGMRLELPAGRLADAVAANRRYLLLMPPSHDASPTENALIVAALDRYGFHLEAAEALVSSVDRDLSGRRGQWEANGAFLWAMTQHWRLTGDIELVRRHVPTIAKAVHGIERTRHIGHDRQRHSGPGDAASDLMPNPVYSDSFWSLRGLRDGADLLGAADEHHAATIAAAWAAGMQKDLDASLAATAGRIGSLAIPVGVDAAAAIGSLAACSPLHLMSGAAPAITATIAAIRKRFCDGEREVEAVVRPGRQAALDPLATLRLAAVELEATDPRAMARLRWLLDGATATWTWPELIDPGSGRGCAGEGHHRPVVAELCSLVRNLLVREVPGGLTLLTLVPEGWWGRPIEVHDAPTNAGELSYAIRWHGERPALLWDLRRRDRQAPARLTIPGLDPAWSSTEPVGEVLLAAAGQPVSGWS